MSRVVGGIQIPRRMSIPARPSRVAASNLGAYRKECCLFIPEPKNSKQPKKKQDLAQAMDALAKLEALAQKTPRGGVEIIDQINRLRGKFVEGFAGASRKK